MSLEQVIKEQASRLGFALAGFTLPGAPPHLNVYEDWLARGGHGAMAYLASERARQCRRAPQQILPACQSILMLGISYHHPGAHREISASEVSAGLGRVAAYAWGEDYHNILLPRLQALVSFIEQQVGHPIPNRYSTDTAPLLERELAQRAGLGWIGKNTCLINPQIGSTFLLAEILLGIALTPDAPFDADRCGACTRCLQACPTRCIRPDRTLDAARCIAYLTIEHKDTIPPELRPRLGNWVFGCDVCQQVCPWNQRFAPAQGEAVFAPQAGRAAPDLAQEISLTPEAFNRKYRRSPLQRAKRRGYLRNVATALGNLHSPQALPALQQALNDAEPLVREHAAWALKPPQGTLPS